MQDVFFMKTLSRFYVFFTIIFLALQFCQDTIQSSNFTLPLAVLYSLFNICDPDRELKSTSTNIVPEKLRDSAFRYPFWFAIIRFFVCGSFMSQLKWVCPTAQSFHLWRCPTNMVREVCGELRSDLSIALRCF